jgi:alkanesulfonate monooxygenase SsuD/methylene tetrahydromethanopterin reductase-like flavin-dependent oxidoreductase (luciferase family)
MKLIQGLTISLLMLSVLICAPVVRASTVTEALDALAQLRAEMEDFTFTGVNAEQDRAFLLRKLDSAKLSVNQARFCRAVKDLQDFNAHMDKLDREGQLQRDGVTVHNRIGSYSLAIGVINDLIAQSGVTCKP